MLKRYGINTRGKRVEVADIYTAEEHRIGNGQIDRDALKVIRRLHNGGFEAYVVGGAVRDLLLGQTPKDFDIATDAQPQQIRKLFRNSRIIGRRFRLVHIFFADMIIEVSTFRGKEVERANNNVFGSLGEDVHRRDFTLNALYYSPQGPYVLDYVGGFKDIQKRQIRSILPLEETFLDDPVRLIRAVKYAAKADFSLSRPLKKAIRKYAGEMGCCSSSRLTEEVFKILQCGKARKIFEELMGYGILPHMLPVISKLTGGKTGVPLLNRWMASLDRLDEAVDGDSNIPRHLMLAYFIEPFLFYREVPAARDAFFVEVFRTMKETFVPITPPNKEVEAAVRELFKMWNIQAPRKRKRHRP